MSAIAGEHTQAAPTGSDKSAAQMARVRDAWRIIAFVGARYGYEYWSVGRWSRWNWFDDATIRDCAMIAAVAGFLFVVRSLTFPRPVVDLRAFGNRNFTLGCILSFITGIGIFSTIYLTPLFLGYVRGFSAWQTGMAIFSTGTGVARRACRSMSCSRKNSTRAGS